MAKTVFLHYTKAELDRNFDQRGWATNAETVIARYVARSATTRRMHRYHADIRYGASSNETLDWFPAATAAAPVHVFVHGGAWRNFTKDDYSFTAESFVAAGNHAVVLNFSNIPAVRLPDMVEQVRCGIAWVRHHAADFGADPQRIHVTGNSSGAHLAALALMDWEAHGLPADLVRTATLVSGPYDLEPVLLSARSVYMTLTPEEARALSPQYHAGRIQCPVLIVYAENDTDEFQRQSREFAAALESAGRLTQLVRISGMNHFELPETLADIASPLVCLILSQLRGDVVRADGRTVT